MQVAGIDFEDGEIVSDTASNPTGADVLADSGQLTSGRQQIVASAGHDDGVARLFELQWRNAANDATIANFRFVVNANVLFKIRLNFSTDERIRWVTVKTVTNTAVTWIAATSATAQSVT